MSRRVSTKLLAKFVNMIAGHVRFRRREINLWIASTCVTVLACMAPTGVNAKTLTGRAYAIDGDTLVISGRHIRLFGVDAFEHDQTCGRFNCGQAATRVLRARLQGQVVSCAQQDVDPYGRMVAICRVGGEDLGQVMARAGLAVAYRHYSLRYLPDEQWAKAHRQGAWAYGFDSPQYWRRTHTH